MAGVAQKLVYELREAVNRKLARLPLKFFDGRPHGDTLSRVVNDIETISGTFQQSLTQFITSIVMLVGAVAMMLSISPLLTLIAVVTLPVSFAAIGFITKRSQRHFRNMQQSLGELNGHVEEMFTGHPVVKAFGRERQSIARFEEVNGRLYEAGWRAQFLSGVIMPVMGFIGNIGYVLVSAAGGLLFMRRALEIGDVQAFISYSRQFTMPITQTAQIANIIQATIAAAERVFELLDEEEEAPEPRDSRPVGKPAGHVRFEQVRFSYRDDAAH